MAIKIRDGGAWVDIASSNASSNVVVNQDNYSCQNPITVIGSTIGIGTTSNAYGTRYVEDHLPLPSDGCDGDLWYYTAGSVSVGVVPAGTVIYSASSTAPTGYIKANGASLDTTTYADLFAAIGYTYGGSGSSFNAPDLRGEFIRGWDDGRGVDSGRSFGSFQSNSTALPNNPFGTSNPGNHNHGYNGGSLKSLQGDNAGNDDYAGGGGTTGGGGSHTHTINGGDAETRPRNRALLALIKY